MPTVYIETDADIDVNDFLEECSDHDIEKIIKWLKLNDYLKRENNYLNRNTTSDEKWNFEVTKLIDNKWKLNKEQESQILNIIDSI